MPNMEWAIITHSTTFKMVHQIPQSLTLGDVWGVKLVIIVSGYYNQQVIIVSIWDADYFRVIL